MVSRNNDNSPTKKASAFPLSLSVGAAVFAWLAFGVGFIFATQFSTVGITSGKWAEKVADPAAAVIACVYLSALILLVLFLCSLIFSWQKWRIGTCGLWGTIPALLLAWGVSERTLAVKPFQIVRPINWYQTLVETNAVGHTRLLGGSLWQKNSENLNAAVYGRSEDDAENSPSQSVDEFLTSMTGALGAGEVTKVRLHFRPLVVAATPSVSAWVNLASAEDQMATSSTLSSEEWYNCARAVLDANLRLNCTPPSILTLGWAEYWSKSSDEVMDQYFQARSGRTSLPSLADLTGATLYSIDNRNQAIVGAAFVTYLLEEKNVGDFLKLCHVDGQAEFAAVTEELLGIEWKATCFDFENWLRLEADRLGWAKSTTFANADLNTAQAIESELNITMNMLSDVKAQTEQEQIVWQELLVQCESLYRQRLAQKVEGGFEKKSVAESLELQATPTTKRTRSLVSNSGCWFSKADSMSEDAIVVAGDRAFRALRNERDKTRVACAIDSDVDRRNARNVAINAIRDWHMEGDLIAELDNRIELANGWFISSISSGGDTDDWTIEMQAGPTDIEDQSSQRRISLKLSPKYNFRIVQQTMTGDAVQRESISREFIASENDFVVTREQRQLGISLDAIDGEKWNTEFSTLTNQQAGSLREELAYMKVVDCNELVVPTPWSLKLMRVFSIAFLTFAAVFGLGWFLLR